MMRRNCPDREAPPVRAEGHAANSVGQFKGEGTVRTAALGDGNRALHAPRRKALPIPTKGHNFGSIAMGGTLQFSSGRKFPNASCAVVGSGTKPGPVFIEGDGRNRVVMFEFKNLAAGVDIPDADQAVATRGVGEGLAVGTDRYIDDRPLWRESLRRSS